MLHKILVSIQIFHEHCYSLDFIPFPPPLSFTFDNIPRELEICKASSSNYVGRVDRRSDLLVRRRARRSRAEVCRSFITPTVREEFQVTPQGHHR